MIQFDFYLAEVGNFSQLRVQRLGDVSVLAPRANARQAVNEKFAELVSSEPEIGRIVVVAGSGEPLIYASERIHSPTVETLERQGRPARELVWMTDEL